MLTLKQAMESEYFHQNGCVRKIGPRGGIKETICVVRRNGRTKTWKRRPGDFKIPVKYGLKQCFYIDNMNERGFHGAEECPLGEREGLFPSKEEWKGGRW